MGRLTIIFAIGGFIVGLFIGLFIYNFYLTNNPKATDTDKGLMAIVSMVCILCFTIVGFKIGEEVDP